MGLQQPQTMRFCEQALASLCNGFRSTKLSSKFGVDTSKLANRDMKLGVGNPASEEKPQVCQCCVEGLWG
eukprot:1491042-Amphidinium_carterae.1